MNEQEMSFDTMQFPDGSICLRIREWTREVEDALRSTRFDWLRLSESIGSFERLIPFSERIYGLHAPQVPSSAGLEKLEHIERIRYIGEVHQPPFDYCRLPRLKSLVCDAALLIPAKYLNHPAIERLDLEGIKAKDLTFLSEAKRLRALRLVGGPMKTLKGLENLPHLRELRLIQVRALCDITALNQAKKIEVLELTKTPNVTDVSSIYGLSNLRWLFLDGRKAKQHDLNWIRNMPHLECAGIWVETETVDWRVFAEHPRLYDVSFYATHNFSTGSDEEIIAQLSMCGRKVKKLTRYPKDIFPAFRIEFVPHSDIADPQPQHVYQNNLIY